MIDKEELRKVQINCPDCMGMGYVYNLSDVCQMRCSRCSGSGAIGFYTPAGEGEEDDKGA